MKLRIKYFTSCFAIIILSHSLLGQNHAIDSLHIVLKTEKNDANKVNTLIALCGKLEIMGSWDSSLAYGESAMELAKNLRFKRGIDDSYNSLGIVYDDEGNYPKALDCYLNALKVSEELEDKRSQAISLCNIGNVYQDQGEYPKALDYQIKALKIDEELGNKQGQAEDLGNIGVDYQDQGNYSKALEYHLKALEIGKKLENKEVQAADLSNIGLAFQELGNYNKAIENYKLALQMAGEIGNMQLQANVMGSMGTLYNQKGKFKQAEDYSKKAIVLDSSMGELYGLREFEESLSRIYDTTGRYKLALMYYKKAMALKDTLFNIDKNKALTRKELTYQYEKKEAQVKGEQDKKDAMAEIDKRKQRIITWSVLVGLLLSVFFAGFIFRSLRLTSKQKEIIELKNRETEKQKTLIEQQKALVEEKNRDIIDSITYAKRLQDAILPPLNLIKQYLPESFVFYKPKDIVAGDFYWLEKAGDTILIAAADCTGHGVPGALVSVVCSNALNRTVKEFKIKNPGKILDKVRELVLETFEKSESNVQDGMDISLCCINTKTREIQWSGAYNSLWYIQHGEIKEVVANKQPIGKIDKPIPFNTHNLHLQKADTLYLFTDGYADQFGGPKGKKFKYKQLQQLIMDNGQLAMEEQKSVLEKTLNNWKGDLEQIDDVLVIGIRI